MTKKNYNMELIRTASFVMVVIVHVANYYCRAYADIGRGEYVFALILDTVSRISVPCFFMLSGALLLNRNEPLRKNGRRLIHILTALIFWSIIYYFFNTRFMGTPYNLAEVLETPVEAHLWYLYAIIPIYLVIPFFQVMCRGMNETLDRALLAVGLGTTMFLYILSFTERETYLDVPIIGDRAYMVYFFLGYFIFKYRDELKKHFSLLMGIFLGSTALNIGMTLWFTYQTGNHYERFLEYGCPLIMISGASFFALLMQIDNGNIHLKDRTRRRIDLWCGCSFGIYLIHIIFLDSYKKYVNPEQLSAWIAVPGLAVGILVLSLISVYLIRKLPFGKYIS
ncbi:acyltransferase [Muricomes intestini]|jgi:surface polysaccharide O-acyltransferase-like enzyme|uniref:Surface polysaccharide O-acyltransferase-like enzyme n=1 Tax=Muricomes intestini TaxID=1796634 RepID=A0A4R3K2W3_9FIRM|nr:acyltransferase family protein [Muricomes intestini]TCS77018.1 surface polysaccharide O-acyltransferase-like enzyme [Muricomes intestini]HAX53252.1 acyltransferase [Lachnospiraceae bacterium]HCR84198.1 acyltransferase [Lachnospiraceae bacterium]